MSPTKIIWALVKFSLCAGLAGGMIDMTRAMMFKAADAHRHGMVSLTELNHRLFGAIK